MKKILAILIPLGLLVLAGCDNVGKAPPGMSENDAKNAIDRMAPEDKIRAIAGSPMPGPEKEKKFREIEQETGVKAADVLRGTQQLPGAGAQ